MGYSKDKDYQALIDEAVKNGDYASASRYEKERNEKIDGEGLSYTKTNNYAKPKGVDDATYNKMQNTSFNSSASVQGATQTAADALHKVNKLTNTDSIISDRTRDAMNGSFNVPGVVKVADRYLAEQIQKIQSGKTSYSDQLQKMMDKIMNRDKFSYDVDQDPLFQQALASAMNSGKQAMQDTIGQASALTGGYGSSYATTAGNQAYNAFIEDAYDNLPQYYQMALEAYQMESDEMYRQYGMISDADDKEFGRYVTAFDATSQHRNRMYDEAYQQYRDAKSDAYADANLQLSEHGQLVSDAYNYYSAASDFGNTAYQREYNEWADAVNLAFKNAEMQNSNWWASAEFDEGTRRFEKEFEESKRVNDANIELEEKRFAEDKRMNDAQLARQRSSGGGGSGGSGGGGGGGSRGYGGGEQTIKFSTTEINAIKEVYKKAGYGDNGVDAVVARLQATGKMPQTDTDEDVVLSILNEVDKERGVKLSKEASVWKPFSKTIERMGLK